MQTINTNKLKSKWTEKGLLQSDVARMIGLSNTSFSLKMNGKIDFSLTEIQKISNLLVLSADERDAIFFAKEREK